RPRHVHSAERLCMECGECLRLAERRLKGGRPMAFTYHSADPDAWRAVGVALDYAKLAVTALWPVRSDGHMGHHSHPGNCEWDMVIICRQLHETRASVFSLKLEDWIASVHPLAVGEADR